MAWLARRFSFAGRARRREYWLFFGVTLVVFLVGAIPDFIRLTSRVATRPVGAPSTSALPADAFYLGLGLIVLVLFAAWVPLCARRLHDMGRSGWLVIACVLVALVPYLGYLLVSLVIGLWPGTAGRNSYGGDPRQPPQQAASEVF